MVSISPRRIELATVVSMVGLSAVAIGCLNVSAASARSRHRSVARPAEQVQPQSRAQPHSFYPENVPGGVPGNLPFNNQIRKLTDPLNANGSGH